MTDIRKFRVDVTQTIEVTLDADKFGDDFLEEFREGFYHFDTLEDHAEHIAQLQARGLIDVSYQGGDFIEGYGDHRDMGINAHVLETQISPALPTNALAADRGGR